MTRFSVLLAAAAIAFLTGPAGAVRESKVSQTKHNLSSSGVGTVKSSSETQICVFCHTPHGADNSQASPLWNKTLATKTYTPYDSSSLDAKAIQGASAGHPLGSSKLCLSCHDGAMQLGAVRVLRGQQNQTIVVDNANAGAMPTGQGISTGFTRQLGGSDNKDLTNDHPISVTYDSTLSQRDGELRQPDSNERFGTVFGKRIAGDHYRPMLPLEPTGASGAGQVQCTTCHDPHIRETNLANEKNIKFLRANRFQLAAPTSSYSAINDIICLACHDKGLQGDGNSWVYSAHANSNVATQLYKTGTGSAAEIREFPDNIPVWKASCLNCHDTHTVTGSRRLLREGVDTAAVGGIKSGGNPAIEETCYQCHRDAAASILVEDTNKVVPNIRSDFQLTYKMPITGTEVHDIGGDPAETTYVNCASTTNKCGADFIEARAKLAQRHAECTDCHNPHRVAKNRLFFGSSGSIQTPDTEGTHNHLDTTSGHTNVASGVLRGTWGVEPSYSSNSFHSLASNYTVRRGDPGNDSIPNTSATDTKSYVTREYQVCLKCHSSFAYGTTPPSTGPSIGLNGLTQYTDQAKEFQAPLSHADEPLSLGNDGGSVDYDSNNHRSWHPVMRATGRTAAKRDLTAANAFNHPFRDVGTQTMYCSDCHGSNTGSSTVIPTNTSATTGAGNPWGPHGSGNPFLLKGVWDHDTSSSTTNALCLKCHNPTSSSGFNGSKGNLHSYHVDRIGSAIQCTWCHIAVPHGWKNKALLVNLNDVGEEAGFAQGSSYEVAINGSSDYYTNPPYYLEAKNKIRSFKASGDWEEGDCGTSSTAKTLANGKLIANSGGGTTNRTGSTKTWMTNTCQSPP